MPENKNYSHNEFLLLNRRREPTSVRAVVVLVSRITSRRQRNRTRQKMSWFALFCLLFFRQCEAHKWYRHHIAILSASASQSHDDDGKVFLDLVCVVLWFHQMSDSTCDTMLFFFLPHRVVSMDVNFKTIKTSGVYVIFSAKTIKKYWKQKLKFIEYDTRYTRKRAV